MVQVNGVERAQPEETAQAVALLHAEHERLKTVSERLADRLLAFFARPLFAGIIALVVVVWVGYNAGAVAWHLAAFDPPPCAWLQGLVALCALFMTVLILGTQRRAARLADHRAQLTLEFAIIGEQKTAKLIALVEELRRDHPEIADRHDSQARAMAVSADAEALLEAIKETHAEIAVE